MTFRDTFTVVVPKLIFEDDEFSRWREGLDGSLALRIDVVIERVEKYGTISEVKCLGSGLYEKKWKSGLRLYFAVVSRSGPRLLLLSGSGKGREQERAILKAQLRLLAYKVICEDIGLK